MLRIKETTLGICLLALTLLAQPALASSIARLGSSDLVEQAELIFQGEVVHRESWQAPNGLIYTAVEFHVQDVIKGDDPGPGLRLRFSGGRVAGTRLSVGVEIPAAGEQGIYFVDSVNRPSPNPLVGWTQGHFVIHSDNSVRSANGALVTDIQAAARSEGIEISDGIPRGFSVINSASSGISPIRGLTPEEFRHKIRELWEGGPVIYREAKPATRAAPPSRKDPALWARENP